MWSRRTWEEIAWRCVKREVIKIETGVNWRKIKAEYIAGGISQRKLAEKYGVNPNLLMRHANKEKWATKRNAAERKALEKVEQKTAEIVADNATLCEQIKTKILRKLDAMIDAYPTNGAEIRREEDGALVTYRLRDLASVYESLSDKIQAGAAVDVEDLTPLAELLK